MDATLMAAVNLPALGVVPGGLQPTHPLAVVPGGLQPTHPLGVVPGGLVSGDGAEDGRLQGKKLNIVNYSENVINKTIRKLRKLRNMTQQGEKKYKIIVFLNTFPTNQILSYKY